MPHYQNKRKILVFIDQMEVGGAGRVTSTMLNGLSSIGEFDLVLACDDVKYSVAYPLSDSIKRVSWHVDRDKLSILSGLNKLRNSLYIARNIIDQEKPDLVIAVTYMVYFQVYLALFGKHIPVIAYDHTSFNRNLGLLAYLVRFNLYRKASKLIVLTEKDRQKLLKYSFKNIEVLYNPLTYSPYYNQAERECIVVCVGRLNSWYVKGIDIMLEVWKDISKYFPAWKLVIAGGGKDESLVYLKDMTFRLGIDNSVEFIGQISDMENLYRKTSVFALPSRVEGFPMGLMEALSQGCPVVSFSVDGAVAEMVHGYDVGFVVEDRDIKGFTKALNTLMAEDSLRCRKGKNAVASIERYSIDNYVYKLLEIIEEVSHEN